MKINISSSDEINYSVLENNITYSETQPINVIGESLQSKMVESREITLEEMEEINKLLVRRNRLLDKRKFLGRSKANAKTHLLGVAFEKGIVNVTERHLVRINLSTAIMGIIQCISNLDFSHTEGMKINLFEVKDELGKLIAGSLTEDEDIHVILSKLLEQNNLYMDTYMNKAFKLEGKNNVIIKDSFNVQKIYNNLSALECFALPIANSLNHLAYIIAEYIEEFLLKTDKRFAIIDNYNMYYFVKGKVINEFLDMEVYLDGIPLGIDVTMVDYKVRV